MLLYKNRSNVSGLLCSNIKQTGDVHLRKGLVERLTSQVRNECGNFMNLTSVQIEDTGFSVPDSFGPNEDRSDKAFVIRGADAYDVADITIFNRCGKEVFRDKSYKNNWAGQGLDEGVYYYLIFMKNGRKVDAYRGWVLLKS